MSTDLIAKIRASPDSERRWATWYRAVYPKIYYAAFRFANGNADTARDLTQEAFTRFLGYRAIDRVTSDQHALAFLIKTCRNLATDRNARAHEISLGGLEEIEAISGAEPAIELSIDLDRMLQNLEPDERQIMLWARDGESVSDIARKLGVSYTAAGVRLHRVRERLRGAFGGV